MKSNWLNEKFKEIHGVKCQFSTWGRKYRTKEKWIGNIKKFGGHLLLPPPPKQNRVKPGQAGVHYLEVTSQFGGASNPPPPTLHVNYTVTVTITIQ